MIALFGLQGYTGRAVASQEMVERQELLWTAEHSPAESEKSDVTRLKEAAAQDALKQH